MEYDNIDILNYEEHSDKWYISLIVYLVVIIVYIIVIVLIYNKK